MFKMSKVRSLNISKELPDRDYLHSASISDHEYKILNIIINSTLLLEKDYHIATSCVPHVIVHTNKYRSGYITAVLATSVNVAVILLNKFGVLSRFKGLSIINACLIAGSAAHFANLIFSNYHEKRVERLMDKHIRTLLIFSKFLERAICDIQEFDKIVVVIGVKKSCESQHMSLENVSTKVLTSITDICLVMSREVCKLRVLVPDSFNCADRAISSSRNLVDAIETSKMAPHNLENLGRMYNESVSRYLRWLALCYCPIKPNNESRMKKVWVDVITSANSVVIKHYVDLKFQCDQYFSRKESGASNRHVEFLTTGVHNIMKHIDSLKEETTALDKAQIVASGLVEKGQWTYEDSVKYFAIKFNDLKLIVDKANNDIIQMDLELKNRVICINGKKVIYPDLNALISNEISPDENTEGLPSNATTVDTGNYVTTQQEKKVTHSELNIPLCRDTSITDYTKGFPSDVPTVANEKQAISINYKNVTRSDLNMPISEEHFF